MTAKLTIAAAREYVVGYHQGNGDTAVRIISARRDQPDLIDVEVAWTDAEGTACRAFWEVFLEDDGCGGLALRGEL